MAGATWSAHDGAERIISVLNTEVAEKLQLLLETKHLYQKVAIDWDRVVAMLKQKMHSAWHEDFVGYIRHLPHIPFSPVTQLRGLDQPQGVLGRVPLVLLLKNVTMFCRECDRREAFRPILYKDLAVELRQLPASKLVRHLPLADTFQDFVLVYQCQRCEGVPETFIVRRHDWILSLDGRSPMASVEAPPYIPKKEAYLFRDAIIAHGSGKTLAGLFYLRTFIEQFGRRITGISGKNTGDEILSEYAKTLPVNLRDSMPSLAEWYGKLSAALHSASPDEELFKNAQEKIEKHFEIRKAMGIPETPVKPPESNSPEVSRRKSAVSK
jgi:hypothetical protein